MMFNVAVEKHALVADYWKTQIDGNFFERDKKNSIQREKTRELKGFTQR